MNDRGAILITGCSTGIGRAAAEHLARRGHPVYATARNLHDITALTASGCETLSLDVTDETSMVAAVKAIEAEHGAIGALVNNAGYALQGPVEELDPDDLRRQFETNVFGLVRLTQLVLPAMREKREGRIINVSSMGGRFTFPGGGAYHATKHAVAAFSDALRFEVRPFGIHTSIIEPGIIRTHFGTTAIATKDEADDSPYAALHAIQRLQLHNAYEGAIGRFAGAGPKAVAKAIEHAITAGHPRTRYRVTPGARVIIAVRRALPDRLWDGLLRTVYR
ncbi:MAG TPA: SDR family NAD(P)-dependent oxidoreductase [Acidimicrobiales bacterium]|nr:SDR family NAD(P)-dependent oxidoreductase [Acidimicrobiales bacterium]